MSIVHIRQISAFLENNYQGLLDVSDLEGRDSAEITTNLLTRALAAFAIKSLAEIPFDVSASSVTDGYGDNGIDAVYYGQNDKVLYLVQSKWISDGNGSVNVGDAQKFIQGFKDIINARFDRFNDKVKHHQGVIDGALNDAHTRIIMVLVYTGTQPLSEEVSQIISDLREEINDPTEILIFKNLRQVNVYSAVAHGAEAQPINIELALHSWGQLREPYLAYYGQVSATEVAQWWQAHFPQIFSPNIRVYLGNTEVNEGITDALRSNPEKFWYFNNGITALCANVNKKPLGGSGRDMGVFECQDFRIVNGAQTVGSIAAAAERYPENVEQARVPIRVISLSETPEEFGKEITKNNNTQNRIDRRDFVALDENQERIKSELHLEGIVYVYKSGESLTQGSEGFDLVEASVALACSSTISGYAVQAKREIGKLWDDISKAPYKALFNAGLSGPHLWRLVLILRLIDRKLEEIRTEETGRKRLCAVHGNRLIAFTVFRALPDTLRTELGDLSEQEKNEVRHKTTEMHKEIFDVLEQHYPDSYPASLFKNQTKSNDIIGRVGADTAAK